MHANNLIHRDFKAMNVLVQGRILKIADLGESKFLSPSSSYRSGIVGTPLFLSPEVIK
jgi:serine/threonine protein kinase